MAERYALDFVKSRGGSDANGDIEAVAGQVDRILMDPGFSPTAYLAGLAKTGRGMSLAEADALEIRRRRGQNFTRDPVLGGGFNDPGQQIQEGHVFRVPIEQTYSGDTYSTDVEVPVGRQWAATTTKR